jgi:hypothetical protein
MPDDLGYELETVQPIAAVNGSILYNRVTRQPLPAGAVDSNGQPLKLGGTPRVIEIDGRHDQKRTSERSDGGNCHLIRQVLPPVMQEPAGYYVLQAAEPHKMRANVVRDDAGKLLALETEPVQSDSSEPNRWGAKQQPGFGST